MSGWANESNGETESVHKPSSTRKTSILKVASDIGRSFDVIVWRSPPQTYTIKYAETTGDSNTVAIGYQAQSPLWASQIASDKYQNHATGITLIILQLQKNAVQYEYNANNNFRFTLTFTEFTFASRSLRMAQKASTRLLSKYSRITRIGKCVLIVWLPNNTLWYLGLPEWGNMC